MTPKPFDFDTDDRLDAYAAGVLRDEADRAAAEQDVLQAALDELLDEIEVDIACGDFGGSTLTAGAEELLLGITQSEERFPRRLWVKNPRLYWAQLLIDHRAEADDALLADFDTVMKDHNYRKAKQYAKDTHPELASRIAALEAKYAAEAARLQAEEEARIRQAEEEARQAEEEARSREAKNEARDSAERAALQRFLQYASVDAQGVLTHYAADDAHVVIPDGVTAIGDSVFTNKAGPVRIDLPSTLRSIGERALNTCASLREIHVPEGTESIGFAAMAGCASLTAVSIPAGALHIGDAVLCNSPKLTSITVDEGNSVYSCEGGFLVSRSDRRLIATSAVADHIPAGVRVIGPYAFQNFASLTSLVIPDGVVSIENGAFYYCPHLSTVSVPRLCQCAPGAFPAHCTVNRR